MSAAVVLTALVVFVAHRRMLAAPSGPTPDRATVSSPLSAIAAAAVACVIFLRSPALPVLGLGAGLIVASVTAGRLDRRIVGRSVDGALLGLLFAATVALGTLARIWLTPSRLMRSASRPATMIIGALAANLINNLPATVLLAADQPAHPAPCSSASTSDRTWPSPARWPPSSGSRSAGRQDPDHQPGGSAPSVSSSSRSPSPSSTSPSAC